MPHMVMHYVYFFHPMSLLDWNAFNSLHIALNVHFFFYVIFSKLDKVIFPWVEKDSHKVNSMG